MLNTKVTLAALIAFVSVISAGPVFAQDSLFFPFFSGQDSYRSAAPAPRVPGYGSYLPDPAYTRPRYRRPRYERPLWFSVRPRPTHTVEKRSPRPKVVVEAKRKRVVTRAEPKVPAAPIMPAKAKSPDQIANPLPALLKDPTLRKGDIVVFDDGPRLFKGRVGEAHSTADFAKPAQVKLSAAARKALIAMRTGTNVAWSADEAETKVAATDKTDTNSAEQSSTAAP